MATTIVLDVSNTTAFPNGVKGISVVVGDQGEPINASYTVPTEGQGQASGPSGVSNGEVTKSVPSSAGKLVITSQVRTYDNVDAANWNYSVLAQCAAFVDKGMIIFAVDGSPLTSAAIRAL